MIDREKCAKWCNIMFELMEVTKVLSDNEAEYIMQNLKILHAEERIKQLRKEENK